MSDAQDSRVGSMFGPYHLKRLLGRGGMGEVYEAEHTVKEWTVAVKLMTAEFSKDPVFRERMKREARIAGRLQEPHVVPIHDYGEVDGQMFLEMRLVEGTDLDSVLKRFGPLTPPRAVAIITQIASALDAAHADGVMHRDVKPQNILITRDDFAYLVDFGIASATTDEKLTQLGTAVGTWKYMAPERFSNDEVTYRADIYALACVLHECLTGAPPYRADSAGTLVSSHLMGPIPQPSAIRPGIPKAFDAVVARGMAKKPEDRYASAGDLALAAHEALSDPDQDHAADILRRSQESTLPEPCSPSPATAPPCQADTTTHRSVSRAGFWGLLRLLTSASHTTAARARRRPGLQPRQKCGQRAPVERDLVTYPSVLGAVAQFHNDNLVGHDVEFVATGRAPGNDLHTPSTEPAIRPQAQTRKPVERGFAAAIADYAVAPAVTSNRRDVPHDPSRSPLAQLPQTITQCENGQPQDNDEHDHADHGRAHRRVSRSRRRRAIWRGPWQRCGDRRIRNPAWRRPRRSPTRTRQIRREC